MSEGLLDQTLSGHRRLSYNDLGKLSWYVMVMERYCYWPAVSQMLTLARFYYPVDVLKGTILEVNSTPTVGMVLLAIFPLE